MVAAMVIPAMVTATPAWAATAMVAEMDTAQAAVETTVVMGTMVLTAIEAADRAATDIGNAFRLIE
jgi:hypothetical protein